MERSEISKILKDPIESVWPTSTPVFNELEIENVLDGKTIRSKVLTLEWVNKDEFWEKVDEIMNDNGRIVAFTVRRLIKSFTFDTPAIYDTWSFRKEQGSIEEEFFCMRPECEYCSTIFSRETLNLVDKDSPDSQEWKNIMSKE